MLLCRRWIWAKAFYDEARLFLVARRREWWPGPYQNLIRIFRASHHRDEALYWTTHSMIERDKAPSSYYARLESKILNDFRTKSNKSLGEYLRIGYC